MSAARSVWSVTTERLNVTLISNQKAAQPEVLVPTCMWVTPLGQAPIRLAGDDAAVLMQMLSTLSPKHGVQPRVPILVKRDGEIGML